VIFKDIFPGLSWTLNFNFKNSEDPGTFKKKMQDFPGSVVTLKPAMSFCAIISCVGYMHQTKLRWLLSQS